MNTWIVGKDLLKHHCLIFYRKGVYPYEYMDSWKRFYKDIHFLSAPGLAWKACLKKTEVKLELLTNVDMLLMVEK